MIGMGTSTRTKSFGSKNIFLYKIIIFLSDSLVLLAFRVVPRDFIKLREFSVQTQVRSTDGFFFLIGYAAILDDTQIFDRLRCKSLRSKLR